MFKFIQKNSLKSLSFGQRTLASSSKVKKPVKIPKKSYELVIIGGGSGGLAVAARFSRYFRSMKYGSIAVIEPKDVHYYQPMWTLVGAGIKPLSESSRPMSKVMPNDVDWINELCSGIDPESNQIRLAGASGSIGYKYLVVAAGIEINWDRVDGLVDALKNPDCNVCSNYSPEFVQKTWKLLQKFQGGNAVFTFPNSPIKCAGAPQKIMYLTDSYLIEKGLRTKTNITYNTSLPLIFGSPYYAKVLMEMCKERNINVNLRTNLVRIDPKKCLAYFENLDNPKQGLIEMNFDLLHVAPPMSAPKFMKSLSMDTSNGFVAVDPKTLQHIKYRNVFSLGDCSSLPTSKTAAAIASQNYILSRNLLQLIQNDNKKNVELSDYQSQASPSPPPSSSNDDKINFNLHYDGYTSCPIVTGNKKCIMAEFDYKLEPIETFPIDQRKQRRIMYYFKKDLLPAMYWHGLLKGYWSGPSTFRKLLHLGFGK